MKFIHAYLKNEKIKKIKAKKSEKIRRCMPEKKMAARLLKSGFYYPRTPKDKIFGKPELF